MLGTAVRTSTYLTRFSLASNILIAALWGCLNAYSYKMYTQVNSTYIYYNLYRHLLTRDVNKPNDYFYLIYVYMLYNVRREHTVHDV